MVSGNILWTTTGYLVDNYKNLWIELFSLWMKCGQLEKLSTR